MDNPEKLTTLGKQEIERTSTKLQHNPETKKMSNTDSTKHNG